MLPSTLYAQIQESKLTDMVFPINIELGGEGGTGLRLEGVRQCWERCQSVA